MAKLLYTAAAAILAAVCSAVDLDINPETPLENVAASFFAFLDRLLTPRQREPGIRVLATLRKAMRSVFNPHRRQDPHA